MSPLLKFYYDRLSQPCRAVELLLKVNNIPFKPVELNLALGEHRDSELKDIIRFKKVPVISDNGFHLCESVAILRYLCREKKVADHWYPRDSRKQARVDEFLEWQHIDLRACCAFYIRQLYFNPFITGRTETPEMEQFHKKRMIYSCNAVENNWLGRGYDFLVGDEITIADLLCICEFEELKLTGYDVREGRPNISAWMNRVQKKTSPHYQQIHSKLNSLASIKGTENILNFLTSKY